MVIGAFPIAKIAILGIKQITKPVAQFVKDIAKHNSLFKSYLCAPAGQFIYCLECRSKMYMLGLPQPKKVPPLTDKMATDVGGDLIGEITVIGIGLYLIYNETSKQAKKDKKKHDKLKQEAIELTTKIEELNCVLDMQDKEIRQMYQQI